MARFSVITVNLAARRELLQLATTGKEHWVHLPAARELPVRSPLRCRGSRELCDLARRGAV